MADFYGSHFEYGGISSRKYGLIFASVTENRFLATAGTIKGDTAFNRKNKKRYLIDDDYSDAPLSFEVEIVTDYDRGIEYSERRKIEKWLFNRHQYKKLYLDIADDCAGETFEIIDGQQKRLFLNCRFINAEKIEGNGGIVGYKATLEADSGLWWQDAVVKEYTINNPSASSSTIITVNVDTDIDDYTYPKVTINMADNAVELTVSISAGEDNVGVVSPVVDADTFLARRREVGEYIFTFNGTDWGVPGSTTTYSVNDLETVFGITYTGTAGNGDTITVTVTPESVIIYNRTEDINRITQLDRMGANAAVILRGDINYVSGQYYEKFTKQNFPRLIDGENRIVVTGKVSSIKFEFNNRRML